MANWDEIKHEYETTKITLAKLAEKYDIPLGTVKSQKSQKSRDTKNGNPWTRDAAKKDATLMKRAVESEEIITNENGDLTDKQWLFCLYYTKYWNATKAYQKAYEVPYNQLEQILQD